MMSKKNPGKGTSKRYRLWQQLRPYVMIAPCMIFLAVFTVYPVCNMIYLSFFDYNLISPKKFTGLQNYYRLFFVNVDFRSALSHTAFYTVFTVVILLVLGLLFAMWFQKSTLLNSAAQRIMFLPHICAMLSVAYIFKWLMSEDGLFNAVLGIFNLPPLRWLDSSTTAMLSIVIVNVWKNVGYYAIILLSSLNTIPAEINEAAALDDAGPLQKFFHITLPMLSPQLFFLLVTITIGSFNVFESVRILTAGGPGNATDVLVYYIYRYAMANLKFGYASAAGVVLFIFVMILTAIYFRLPGKHVHYQ